MTLPFATNRTSNVTRLLVVPEVMAITASHGKRGCSCESYFRRRSAIFLLPFCDRETICLAYSGATVKREREPD